MRSRVLIVLVLIVLVVFALGVAACGGGDEQSNTGSADTGLVDTGIVDTGAIETTPTETGPDVAVLVITVPRAGEVIGPQSPSARIKELQQALKALGFKVSTDGQYGPRTVKAVKKFQKQHKLEQDGLVGAKTARAINKELRAQAKNG
jgi:peptidoglycan hydrolase-like protein with peptidoglycan-binding domain